MHTPVLIKCLMEINWFLFCSHTKRYGLDAQDAGVCNVMYMWNHFFFFCHLQIGVGVRLLCFVSSHFFCATVVVVDAIYLASSCWIDTHWIQINVPFICLNYLWQLTSKTHTHTYKVSGNIRNELNDLRRFPFHLLWSLTCVFFYVDVLLLHSIRR